MNSRCATFAHAGVGGFQGKYHAGQKVMTGIGLLRETG
jgi:hypothetical protein